LITGGLGGIGLTLAEFLGRAVAARIVVTARSEFPTRERWDDWLSAQGDDEVSHCIRRIRAIEGHSAKVLIIRADVTQPEQMRAAVAQTLERLGALHGVIHAAGIPGAGVIALKSFAAAQSVLAPKITGTLVALEAVEHLDLDFFIVCSSIGSIVTLPGQFDYCAANAFLDAFAHVHDRNGRTRFISINWDGWREVGMAARAATLGTASTPDLEHALSCQDGVEVFRQVLAMPRPQWIISTRPLAARIVKTRDTSGRSSAPERVPRAPRDTLTQIWCDLLGVQQPRQDDDFFALGGDSLLASQLIAQLESRCGVSISMRQLLRAPTLAGLASLLESQAATANRQENVC
jgi:NAD(P)-dependent dehydrogenase (short-subunit alcohol dehydrogenase family)/acyl carrier protein